MHLSACACVFHPVLVTCLCPRPSLISFSSLSFPSPVFSPRAWSRGDVVEGLWHAALNFTRAFGVEARWLHGHRSFRHWGLDGLFSQVPAFNTNCEVASLALLRSDNVQKLHRFLDQKGGYFLQSDGDASRDKRRPGRTAPRSLDRWACTVSSPWPARVCVCVCVCVRVRAAGGATPPSASWACR